MNIKLYTSASGIRAYLNGASGVVCNTVPKSQTTVEISVNAMDVDVDQNSLPPNATVPYDMVVLYPRKILVDTIDQIEWAKTTAHTNDLSEIRTDYANQDESNRAVLKPSQWIYLIAVGIRVLSIAYTTRRGQFKPDEASRDALFELSTFDVQEMIKEVSSFNTLGMIDHLNSNDKPRALELGADLKEAFEDITAWFEEMFENSQDQDTSMVYSVCIRIMNMLLANVTWK